MVGYQYPPPAEENGNTDVGPEIADNDVVTAIAIKSPVLVVGMCWALSEGIVTSFADLISVLVGQISHLYWLTKDILNTVVYV